MIYDFSVESFQAIQRLNSLRHNATSEIEFDGTVINGESDFILDWQNLFTRLSCATIAFHDADDQTLQQFLPILVQNPQVKNIKFHRISLQRFHTLQEVAIRRKDDVTLTLVSPRAKRQLKRSFDRVFSAATIESSLAASPSGLPMLDLDNIDFMSSAMEVGSPPRLSARLPAACLTPARRSPRKSLTMPSPLSPPELNMSMLTIEATPATKIATQFGLTFSGYKPLAPGVGLRFYNYKANLQSLFLYVDGNLKQIFTLPENGSYSYDHKKLTISPDRVEIFYRE